MKVDDRTRYIVSAVAVGMSILGLICSWVLIIVGHVRHYFLLHAIGTVVMVASIFLFYFSGVVGRRLRARKSEAFESLGKAKILVQIAPLLILMIYLALILPFGLFLVFMGCAAFGLAVGLWIKRADYFKSPKSP